MSDVFISYARPDEPQAKQVAEVLQQAGYRVWRDDALPAHRAYAEVIEERLDEAKAVVALWSAEAVRSQWVRAEADAARQSGKLVQASLDGTPPPIPFNQIQYADLRQWSGEASAPGWQKLAASIAALVQRRAMPESASVGQAPARGPSICVLPFQNMSGDPEQEYFSDGISEDITTDLSKVSALGVTARNTAFTFKGQAVDVREVARKLGVSHVLEGSVRKAGERVRISAQLIDGASGDHLWAERYDRDLTDIFAIQDEISKAIVDSLKVKLLPEEKKAIESRGTTSADAYNLYLMARQYWVTGNHGDTRREERVVRICERALRIDPNYAQVWALLGVAQSGLRYGYGKPVDDGVSAAEKALSLDSLIAEARVPLARKLIEEHRYDEAEAEIEAGLQIDPNSWELNKEASRLHARQRHFRKAAEYVKRSVAAMPTDYYSWGILMICCRAIGDTANARRAAENGLEQAEHVLGEDSTNGAALSVGARALAELGQAEKARDWIERALLLDPDNLSVRYDSGSIYAGLLGDGERALDLIVPVLKCSTGTLISYAKVDPDIDLLREDPRFQSALAEAEGRLASAKVS